MDTLSGHVKREILARPTCDSRQDVRAGDRCATFGSLTVRWGPSRDFGQASEVRGGGLKLGFAMQTLEEPAVPVHGLSRAFHTSTPGQKNSKTKVETSSFPPAGRFHLPAQHINLVYRAAQD